MAKKRKYLVNLRDQDATKTEKLPKTKSEK